MKNKILYIDPLLQKGHINFNNIYIKNLEKAGYDLNFIFVKGYERKLNIDNSKIIFSIPKFLFGNDYGKLLNRVAYFIALILIKTKINFKKYDQVIFSSFEEISFSLSGIKNVYLINHINVSNSVESKIKFSFLHRILTTNSLIVLDQSISKFLITKGYKDIYFLPHGLPAPKLFPKIVEDDENYSLFKSFNKYRKIIFSPSESSSDKVLINKLIESEDFTNYIEEQNILFIYKDNFESTKPNIITINSFLSYKAYDYLFLNADLILLAYPNSFKYRVSGILLECFANNKPCAISSEDIMESFGEFFCYDPYFSSASDLVTIIDNFSKTQYGNFFKKLELLEPNFNNFFK